MSDRCEANSSIKTQTCQLVVNDEETMESRNRIVVPTCNKRTEEPLSCEKHYVKTIQSIRR